MLSPDLFNLYVDDLPDRLIRVCGQFGGCPRYGGVSIPIIMYADDQTLFHWRADAMQAMLAEVERYSHEHQYEYNTNKCLVTYPASSSRRPLTLYGVPIAAANETALLGVCLNDGLVAHNRQLTSRLAQAERALIGLDRLGALPTPDLTIAKKRLLLTAYGRSRVEYGLAIAPLSETALGPVDSLMRSFTGRLFGSGRGTLLTMRYCRSYLLPRDWREYG